MLKIRVGNLVLNLFFRKLTTCHIGPASDWLRVAQQPIGTRCEGGLQTRFEANLHTGFEVLFQTLSGLKAFFKLGQHWCRPINTNALYAKKLSLHLNPCPNSRSRNDIHFLIRSLLKIQSASDRPLVTQKRLRGKNTHRPCPSPPKKRKRSWNFATLYKINNPESSRSIGPWSTEE